MNILCNSNSYFIYLPFSKWKFLTVNWVEKRKALLHDNRYDPDYSKVLIFLKERLFYWNAVIFCIPTFCYQLYNLKYQLEVCSNQIWTKSYLRSARPCLHPFHRQKIPKASEQYLMINHAHYLSEGFLYVCLKHLF